MTDGTAMCSVMTKSTPASMPCLKARNSWASTSSAGLSIQAQPGLAGHLLDVAAAGEMLGRGQHAVVVIAADVGPDHAAEQVQVAAEGADALGRVVGAPGDVDDRRVGQMDAHGPALDGAGRSRPVHEVLGAGGGEGHVGRVFARARHLLARAAFEVGGDEERDLGFFLEAVEEVGDVARRPAVEDEHAHAVVAGQA